MLSPPTISHIYLRYSIGKMTHRPKVLQKRAVQPISIEQTELATSNLALLKLIGHCGTKHCSTWRRTLCPSCLYWNRCSAKWHTLPSSEKHRLPPPNGITISTVSPHSCKNYWVTQISHACVIARGTGEAIWKCAGPSLGHSAVMTPYRYELCAWKEQLKQWITCSPTNQQSQPFTVQLN